MTTYFVDASVAASGNGLSAGAAFKTLAEAITAATTTGDTIKLADGVYSGNFTITTDGLTIEADTGATDVVVKGTFKTDNGIGSGTVVGDWLETAASYNGNAGAAFSVDADNVTIRNITIAEYRTGIDLQSNDGLTIDNVDLVENIFGVYKESPTSAIVHDVTNFEMTGGTISGGYIGIYSQAATIPNASPAGSFDNVTISGVTFEHLTQKGIYAEQLNDAVISDIVMNDVGQYGGGPAFGANGLNGAGIDINLKFSDFANITIEDFSFTDVGLSNRDGLGSPHLNGGAIHIKARDDGGTYGTDPAHLNGVTVQNGTIDGTSTGIRVGEPGKTTAGPSGITITNVDIDDAVVGSYDNQTTSALTVTLTDGNDTVKTNPAATGQINYLGEDGDDYIFADAGDDTVDGGLGSDTYDMSGAGSGTAIVDLQSELAFSTATGTDTIIGFENVKGGGGNDNLKGTADANTFIASGGTDSIDGRGGSDTFDASAATTAMTVSLDSLSGSASGGGFTATLEDVENVKTGSGGDSITGSSSNNAVDGGAGVDTFTSAGTYSENSITYSGGSFTVAAGAGTDTLTNVEKAVVNSTTVWLVDTAAELAAALLGAADGDVIQLASGTYEGTFTTNGQAVTILGANHGIDGSGGRGAESTIKGHLVLTGSNDVRVDGVELLADATTGTVGHGNAAIQLHGSGDYTIENSVFFNAIVGGNTEATGIMLDTTVSGHVTIDGNLFTGNSHTGFSGANWQRGIWSDGTTSELDITGNHFHGVRSGLNLDGYDNSKVDVSNNTFETHGGVATVGSAISIGLPTGSSYTGIHDNDFSGASGDLNFRNVTSDVDFDYSGTGNTSTTSVEILGGTGNDDITGSDGIDVIAGDGLKPGETGGAAGSYNAPGLGDDTIDALGGNDFVFGQSGSDTIDGGAGDDTIDGGLDDDDMTGGDGNDTYVVDNADDHTIETNGALSGTDLVQSSVSWTLEANVENLTLTGTATSGTGNASDNTITGNASDNTLKGAGGTDAIDGAGGVDTAAYDENYADADIDFQGGAFTIAANGATDTLANVEKASFGDGQTVWLVDNAAELTAALSGAGAGDIIKLASGTYVGSFTIGTDVTLESVSGNAADVTIKGDFREANPAMGSANFADWLSAPTTTAYNSGSLQTGLTIAGNGVTVRGITIANFLTGINIGSNNGLTLENIDIDSTVTGVRKGTAAVVTDFDWIGGNVTNSYHGATFNAAADDSGEFSDVLIQGVSFSHLAEKGLYFEQLDNAHLLDIIMNDVGQLGRGPAFGGTGQNAHGFGAGIDINLKYEGYSNIEIADFNFTNVGLSDGGTGTPHAFGGAITVKARDDAPSYGTDPATLTGVNIHDGTINGTSTGIRIGEPTKTNAGPDDVSVTNVTIVNAVSAEYDNRTGSTLEVTLGNDHDVSSSVDATGVIAYTGSSGSDTYTVNEGDTVTEASGGGTDIVNARGDFTLDANVENLNLLDAGSGDDDFENFTPGLITDGENGWNVDNTPRGTVVTDPDDASNQVMLISSDPTDGTFGGPYSHDIGVSAGEPSTTADGDVHVISFRVKAVDSTPDNSRMEVDFGNVAGTDRNNFMVIESIAGQGIRIAVADPLLDGHWNTGAGQDDFSAFTGNRTLISGVDPTGWLDIELRLTYNDGQDNDVIEVYLNGALIGTTTTFENYRDSLGGTHSANAEANQTSRILFRGSASTAPTDGPGGVNKGFYFDDLSSTVTTHADGTGNGSANVINGNAGDNVLTGLAGNDTLNGGDGNDTLDGGADVDTLNGGEGNDTILASLGDTDTIDGGAGSDTLNASGGAGNDTAQVVFSGGVITTLGGNSSNVETVNLDLDGGNDTLDYSGSTQSVTVNLAAGTASGLGSIANMENVTGGGSSDSLTGNSGSNTLDGGAGSDTIDGGADTDTVLGYGAGFHLEIQAGKWVVTNGTDTDVLTNVEKVTIGSTTYILVDNFADGGFGSVQAAIDSASGGETILIAPGSYTETANYNPTTHANDPSFTNPVGLVISKSGITLQGVTSTGALITDANSTVATINSGVQSNWGTNFMVTGDNVTIKGLTLNGTDNGGGEINKVIEVVGNGFTLQYSVVGAADGIEVASTVYINDEVATSSPAFVSHITSYLLDHNIFEGSVVITNGPGTGHTPGSVDFQITDNDFVLNPGSDVGYNWGILLNGQESTIPWRLASIVLPEITGNTFTSDYAIYLRALDDDPAKTPDRAYVDAFIANNVSGDYAFAAEADGDPQLNASSANRFYIHNALDAAVGDAVTGGSVVFRVAADTSYTVDKDGLTFDAQDGSGAITLTLGTADDINLAGDQAVTIFGNGNANTINGNEADNFLAGVGGDDTINGGAGSDTIDAGGGIDTVVFDDDYADLTITRIGATNNYIVEHENGDTDTVLNVENFTIDGHTVSAASAVTDADPVIVSILDSDTSSSTLLVTENTAAGTTVAAVTATDPNGVLDTLTYSLLNPDNSPYTGPFEVDATGAIKVKTGATLDFEGINSFTVKVQVTDAHGNTDTETVTINLTDVDEFNVSVPVDGDAAVNAINENAAIGSLVGVTASASDADGTTNAVTYSLSSNPDGLFAIDGTTGAVTVAAAIDRETHGASRTIEVTATSADGSTSVQTFTIAIGDVDEFNATSPVVDNNAAADAINENVAIGTAVGITAFASDADATNNTVTYSLSSNPDGLFAIDVNTGVVTTAAAIDREVVGATRTIEVTATSSDGSTSTQSFNIVIGDVDESDVSTPVDSNGAANTVNENASIGSLVGVTASAADADATNNGVTYTLSSNPDGLFAIDVNTGVVTTAAAIDREVVGATRTIEVTATSADGSTSTQTFNVAIGDVDESDVSTPVDSNGAANAINENVAIGTTVGITASASDADATTNAITYSLSSNPDGLFAIDTNTGVVTTAAAINRETVGATRNIQVTATSADGSTSVQTFTIAIGDIDEFNVSTPTDSNAAVDTVNENVAIGTAVGVTASASDADATTNAITYSLSSNPDGLFAIDVNTGVVTTAAALNREVHGASRNIQVTATSADGSTAVQTFTIAIGDVDEFNISSPVVDNNGVPNAVDEGTQIDRVVGVTAFASDADATTNGVTYSLSSNPGGLFKIDATTGVVTTAAAIDRETMGATRNIQVTATSADGSTSVQTFTIAIGNVDEGGMQSGDANVEAGLRHAALGLQTQVDPDGAQTFTITALPAAGTLLLNGVAVTVNQVLTEAQFEALTYASPQTAQDVTVQFSVSDGVFAPHTETITITVDPADDTTYPGTAAANELDGGAGNDLINGGAGADLMIGGTGDDTFIVSQSGDKVDEVGGSGIDLVQASVSYNLGSAAHVAGSVENLQLTGAAAIAGIGNSIANVITGNAAANTLIGNNGSDKLNGRQGLDTLAGGNGNDAFVFDVLPTAGNLDKITDFSNVSGNNDIFHLEGSVFTGLGANGTLNSALFFAGAAAHDANDRIVYNQATGAVFFDSNGNAAGGAFQIATILNKPTLTHGDFLVI